MTSDLLPLAVAAGLAAVLLILAHTILKPDPKLGEAGTLIEARALAHDWSVHAAVGLIFCGALVLSAPFLVPQGVVIGGALVGVLAALVASAISRPPTPIRFFDKWLLAHPFVSSFTGHAIAGGALSLLVPARLPFYVGL